LPLTEKTVIIAPHPDDEVIGCAGLIQALVERGTPPHVIILTGGEGSHRGCCNTSTEEIIAARHQLTLKTAATLGLPVSHIHCLHYPDGGVALEHPETERLQEFLSELAPQAVFVPHRGEGWSDHLQAAEITKHMLKGLDVSIYEYCVWMWYYNVWDFRMKDAFLLRLSETQHRKKQKAIEQYVTPIAPCGKPWSGVLPKPFLKATRWDKELYFRVR
jgi:LmbE family N-acetylglucosaminyl deacetylase